MQGMLHTELVCAQCHCLCLPAEEFIRRFLLYVLPRGFHRIGYYGFLGNRLRREKLARCRVLLGVTVPQRPRSNPRIRIFMTGTKSSPGPPCASVRFVTAVTWSSWNC